LRDRFAKTENPREDIRDRRERPCPMIPKRFPTGEILREPGEAFGERGERPFPKMPRAFPAFPKAFPRVFSAGEAGKGLREGFRTVRVEGPGPFPVSYGVIW
ncbi:MAG: hypothetical protein ACJ75H_22675, partial [Thermoanaerobaculia bacterium]